MRQWMIVLAAAGIMLMGFVASLIIFGDQSRVKQLLASHVSMQTGRQMTIDGAVSVRFFPRFRIQAEQVSLSGPSDFSGPELLSSDRMLVEVRLLPLIRGRVETREVILQGTRVHMGVDETGGHSLGGLMLRSGRDGAPGISASGPVRLEDVAIEISGLNLGAAQELQIDRIELDGLVFDRSLNLSFRGAMGRPPVISDVVVDGLLFVPAGTGHFRLADMRWSGRHEAAGVPFELLGAMSFSAIPPLTITLDESRLRVEGQEMRVQGSYQGLTRPRLALSAAATELNLQTVSAALPVEAPLVWPSWLANAVAEHDVHIELAIDRLRVGEYEIPEVRLRLAAEDGVGQVSLQETSLPGALLRADGVVETRDAVAEVDLVTVLDVDDLGVLLRAGQFALDAEGVGQVRFRPGSRDNGDGLAMAELEFFAGRLAALEPLREQAGVSGGDGFDILNGQLQVHADAVLFPTLTVRDEFSEIRLQGVMLRRSGRLSGTVVVQSAEQTLQFELGGSSARPQFVPISSLTGSR